MEVGLALKSSLKFLGAGFSVGRARDQHAFAVLVHDHGQGRLGAGLQRADGHGQRACRQKGEWWERRSARFCPSLRHADLMLLAAEEKNLRRAVAVPVADGQFGDAA